MKTKTILLHYGEGGHRAEIERLYALLGTEENNVRYIGLCEGKYVSNKLKNYRLLPMRSKYSKLVTLALIPCAIVYNLCKVVFLVIRYDPAGLISTGPGSVLLPAAIFRLFHKKVIYIETGSRFYSMSLSGKYLTHIANRFYVQNKELLNIYTGAIYAGLL
jgi:UDP-N-acetylglucosamine:LPS N-acetylglucosamine transferase